MKAIYLIVKNGELNDTTRRQEKIPQCYPNGGCSAKDQAYRDIPSVDAIEEDISTLLALIMFE